MKQRYELVNDKSNKFWEAEIYGDAFNVYYGRIGNTGKTYAKNFHSPAEASAEYKNLILEKLVKGYKPAPSTVQTLLAQSERESSAAVLSADVGKHIGNTAKDLCAWLTCCIQNGMSPERFFGIWDKLTDEDENLYETLGRTREGDYWLERFSFYDDIDIFYKESVKKTADRFITFDHNSYVDIVAMRGDPGARAIEVCVLGEKNCRSDTGEWYIKWPQELGPGAAIEYLWEGASPSAIAELRDGKEIIVK